jgi:hypothetical protein
MSEFVEEGRCMGDRDDHEKEFPLIAYVRSVDIITLNKIATASWYAGCTYRLS